MLPSPNLENMEVYGKAAEDIVKSCCSTPELDLNIMQNSKSLVDEKFETNLRNKSVKTPRQTQTVEI